MLNAHVELSSISCCSVWLQQCPKWTRRPESVQFAQILQMRVQTPLGVLGFVLFLVCSPPLERSLSLYFNKDLGNFGTTVSRLRGGGGGTGSVVRGETEHEEVSLKWRLCWNVDKCEGSRSWLLPAPHLHDTYQLLTDVVQVHNSLLYPEPNWTHKYTTEKSFRVVFFFQICGKICHLAVNSNCKRSFRAEKRTHNKEIAIF
jgi:hypothetical protein